MSEFESLRTALEGHFDKPFTKLPAALRRRVKKAFQISWRGLSPDRRRYLADEWDTKNNPANFDEAERAWEAFNEQMLQNNKLSDALSDLSREIAEWEKASASTVGEVGKRQKRLAALLTKRETIEQALAANRALIDGRASAIQAAPVIARIPPGRPTSKPLVAAELQRRIDAGQLEPGVAAQARALKDWLWRAHRRAIQPALQTIENNISAEFRQAKMARDRAKEPAGASSGAGKK